MKLSNPIKTVDKFLNGITMYRLVLYFLLALYAFSLILSVLGELPYSPLGLISSSVIVVTLSLLFNKTLAGIQKVPTNSDSVYITAFLIFFLLLPPDGDWKRYTLECLIVTAVAIGSKYFIVKERKHLFNPTAIGFVAGAVVLGVSASWWVAGDWRLVFAIILFGALIVRKLRHSDLFFSFVLSYILMMLATSWLTKGSVDPNIIRYLVFSPLVFFAFFMLTEPLTTPPGRRLRIWYGLITGALYAGSMYVGSRFASPEVVLVIANLLSWAVSPKYRLVLSLLAKKKIAEGVYEFSWNPTRPFSFEPGQYLEWTLPSHKTDSRGNRRFFTIASSPTEGDVKLGVKFYDKPSTFKTALMKYEVGETLVASQLSGDFVMPADKSRKLVFIAGGIGVTPFRSMVKYLIDKSESRDITLFYSNKTEGEIAYRDLLEEAKSKIGLKVVYTLVSDIRSDWTGERGFITEEMIRKYAPDFKERMFYISGPEAMVSSFKKMLLSMRLRRSQIVTDYFPGFA